MKLLAVTMVPLLLVTPVLGQEKVESKTEKLSEKAKPTVTFYFFDK